MFKKILWGIYLITIFLKEIHLQPISEENLTEINTENPIKIVEDDKKSNPEDLDEETKLKCKHYYELFQQKLDEIESKNQKTQENDFKKLDQESSQSTKYDFKVNNIGVQSLPYPERTFFNQNPDKNVPKPNSKGPIPEYAPIFTNNGYYQYVPLDPQFNGYAQNYLQPPLETKPVQFNYQNPEYMSVSPLSLQNSLISDGKMIYYWYKSSPNYQIYIPNDNNNNKKTGNGKNGFDKIDENELSTSTTTESTTTITTSTEPIKQTEPTKIEEMKPNLYEHQLKFIFPVQFPKPESVNLPHDMDPYAYYPKELQPEFVNLQMPYVPTFYMIKRLTVPHNHNHEIETNLDDVTS